ncbi:MAG TPA: porin [Chitinophagales bacterium]|nr:porin [Chitinophagales bacterium]
MKQLNPVYFKLLLAFVFVVSLSAITRANPEVAKVDSLKLGKRTVALPTWFSLKSGIGITTPDKFFSIYMRFRIQSRVGYISTSDKDFTPEEFDFRVRRIRLRLGGYIYTPALTYNIQLSFSRADMDWDVSGVPNVLRDAMISYTIPQGFTFSMGQGKLPGNRQRVNSSGELQFADRSIVNGALTLDRDFGAFVNYTNHYKDFHFIIKTAITSGEGRNIVKTDKGLAYTARVEFLPLGKFTDGGDYFEGDLVGEKKPKLNFGGVVSYNHLAQRTGGQLGLNLYEPKNMLSAMGDLVLKYRGFAFTSEYLYRKVDNPKSFNEDSSSMRYAYAGMGVNTQASYCFKKPMVEIAVRHSLLVPSVQIQDKEKMKSEYAICLTKYFMGHKLKIQTDLTYQRQYDMVKKANHHNNLGWRFQIELGI